jgi:hypothetical protein
MIKHRNSLLIFLVCLVLALICGYYAYSAIVNTEAIYNQNPTAITALRGYAKLRSASALTTSYVDTDTVKLAPYSNVALLFDVTKGSITSMEYKILQSYDGYIWFDEAAESVSSTVITDYIIYYQRTLSGTTEKYYKTISFYGNYLKLQIKCTGTVTGNSCAVYLLSSQN